MAEKDSQTAKSAKSFAERMFPAEFVDLGTNRVAAMADMQKELMTCIEETYRGWLERAQSEADAAAELVSKLTAARSVPDSAAAWQEWMTRRMDMLADDGRRFAQDGQKFMTASTRLLSNGWTGAST